MDQINQVNIAVRPETPIDVFIIVFAATAPATPSSIITNPAKYIPASPKYFASLYKDLSNLIDLTIIFKNCANINLLPKLIRISNY